jgi:hypothetical protein
VSDGLITYGTEVKPYYVAVCEHGFGVHKVPAMAIRMAQMEVPVNDRPSQLLIYEAQEFVQPTGFKGGAPQWPNGVKPRLVGLTTTHSGFRQRPR